MNTDPGDTEAIVRQHLRAFAQQQGLDAILNDYADDACLLIDSRAYCGRSAIREFFQGFLAGLPEGAVGQFALRSLRVQGEVACITWSAGPELPLGTDTFVVRRGRIVAQTVAMFAAPAG